VYTGASRWGGGGILSTLARFALPLLRTFAGHALDVIENRRPSKDAFIDNTMLEVRTAI
jgi:hypothetical protein